jgi:hypothetical protein
MITIKRGVKMSEKITYNQALNKMAWLENRVHLKSNLNLFDRALILSYLFDIDKEEILEALLKKRGVSNG